MMLNKVDLPQPDGPITARNSPGATSNETSSRAVMSPSAVAKRITMSSTTRIAVFAGWTGITRSLVETSAIDLSASGARHGGRHDRGIARVDPHIDHGHMTCIDRRDGLFQHGREIAGFGDRAEADRALGAAHGGEIDVGVGHALADPFILARAIARARHALLVQLVVIERP